MLIKELIKELEKLPQDASIGWWDSDYETGRGFEEITLVSEDKDKSRYYVQ
jgi:hypothetical protein